MLARDAPGRLTMLECRFNKTTHHPSLPKAERLWHAVTLWTQSLPPTHGMGRMRGGRVRWRAWRARARPGRAGLAAWRVRGRVAQAWAAGARALGAGAGFGLQLRARAALGEGAGRARRPSAWPGRARGSSVAGVWPQDAGQRWVGLHVHAARGLGGFVCRMQAVEGRPLARAGSDA